MDVTAIAASTGWRVLHLAETASTNDDAARLREQGATGRTAVVADAQTAGRGREGRTFSSPPGGLYVSLLLDVPPEDRPAGAVALAAVAVCQAIERTAPMLGAVQIKWPNDIWVDRKKMAGILVEAAGDDPLVIVGIGINVERVPDELDPALRARTASLASSAEGWDQRIDDAVRELLLQHLLESIDQIQSDMRHVEGRDTLERIWGARLALLGERVLYTFAGKRLEGVLESVSLSDGLLVRDPTAGPVWRDPALVQDLTPCEP